MINIGKKTWTVIGLTLLMSSIGCKTTSMPKLPRLGWLGPRDAETVVAAETKPATELPPPSSAAVPKSPVRQATASQTPVRSEPMANAAVNTEPLTTYPATPYPNFQVAQTNSPAPPNYTAGPYGTAAAQPGGNMPIPQATAAQPQAQQGFYDTNYDGSTPLGPPQAADAYAPNRSMPTSDASTGLAPSTQQNPATASPYAGQQAASANMSAPQATPQSYSPHSHYAAPIAATAPAGANSVAATYMTDAQAASAQTDAGPSSPSYYSTAQQQADSPWRPGSTACQGGTCFASPGSVAGSSTVAASQAAPEAAQPYQTQAGVNRMAGQTEGMQPSDSSSRESTWR